MNESLLMPYISLEAEQNVKLTIILQLTLQSSHAFFMKTNRSNLQKKSPTLLWLKTKTVDQNVWDLLQFNVKALWNIDHFWGRLLCFCNFWLTEGYMHDMISWQGKWETTTCFNIDEYEVFQLHGCVSPWYKRWDWIVIRKKQKIDALWKCLFSCCWAPDNPQIVQQSSIGSLILGLHFCLWWITEFALECVSQSQHNL